MITGDTAPFVHVVVAGSKASTGCGIWRAPMR
jgi:hypothetical protein